MEITVKETKSVLVEYNDLGATVTMELAELPSYRTESGYYYCYLLKGDSICHLRLSAPSLKALQAAINEMLEPSEAGPSNDELPLFKGLD